MCHIVQVLCDDGDALHELVAVVGVDLEVVGVAQVDGRRELGVDGGAELRLLVALLGRVHLGVEGVLITVLSAAKKRPQICRITHFIVQ